MTSTDDYRGHIHAGARDAKLSNSRRSPPLHEPPLPPINVLRERVNKEIVDGARATEQSTKCHPQYGKDYLANGRHFNGQGKPYIPPTRNGIRRSVMKTDAPTYYTDELGICQPMEIALEVIKKELEVTKVVLQKYKVDRNRWADRASNFEQANLVLSSRVDELEGMVEDLEDRMYESDRDG